MGLGLTEDLRKALNANEFLRQSVERFRGRSTLISDERSLPISVTSQPCFSSVAARADSLRLCLFTTSSAEHQRSSVRTFTPTPAKWSRDKPTIRCCSKLFAGELSHDDSVQE